MLRVAAWFDFVCGNRGGARRRRRRKWKWKWDWVGMAAASLACSAKLVLPSLSGLQQWKQRHGCSSTSGNAVLPLSLPSRFQGASSSLGTTSSSTSRVVPGLCANLLNSVDPHLAMVAG